MKKNRHNIFGIIVLSIYLQVSFCFAADSETVRSTGNIPVKALALKQKAFSKSGFEAIDLYKEALKIYPEYDTVYNNIGVE